MATPAVGVGAGVLLISLCAVLSTVESAETAVSSEGANSQHDTPPIDLFEQKQAFFQVETPKSPKMYKYIWMTTETQELRLRVKGRQGAHIALAKTPKDLDNAYEVILCRHNPGRQTIDILEAIDGSIAKSQSVLNCLSQRDYKAFWISWADGRIRVGLGDNVGQLMKVSWAPTEGKLRAITGISMDTWTTAVLNWQFLRDSARDLWLWSAGGDSNSDIWFTEPVRKHFTFGARGCADAKIGLSNGPGMGSAGSYQTHVIILGQSGNKDESIIKEQIGGGTVYRVSTPAILSCTDVRYFWVSWETGYIQVGKGLKVGDNMFMNWLPPNAHNISSVTPFFGNSGVSDPEFHFRNVEENFYLLKSQVEFKYETSHSINMEQRTSFTFKVRACNDAVLNLRRKAFEHTAGTPKNIELVLATSASKGKKTKLNFRWSDGRLDMGFERDTIDLLDCYEFRHLWLGWHYGWLRLGSGDVPYENEIFKHGDPYSSLSVESLQLGSADAENPAEWQFSRSQAKTMTIPVQPALGQDQAWLAAAEITDFVFKVKGKTRVHLLLTTYLGNAVVQKYTIRLSNSAEDMTAIWRDDDEASGRKRNTRNVLSDTQLRPFWVAWTGARVQVGKGVDIGRNVLLAFYDNAGAMEINAIAFAGATTGLSTWEVGDASVPQFTVYTGKSEPGVFDQFWMIPSVYVLPFSVRADKVVSLALAEHPNSPGTKYEITIDGDKAEIKVTGATRTTFINKTVRDIISKDELRPFWVSWFNRTINVGRGLPLEGLLATVPLTKEPQIGGVALAYGGDLRPGAEWKFPSEMASEVKMKTRAELKYDQLWVDAGSRTSQVFRIKAKANATIALALTSEFTNTNVYFIVLGRKNNQESAITKREDLSDVDLVKKTTVNILNENQERMFWVSWRGREIKVGRGPDVNVKQFMRYYNNKESFPVHAMSIATDGTTGAWELYQLKGDIYHMTTFPNGNLTNYMTTENDYISFSLYGCSPAAIFLLEDPIPKPTGYDMYEITIGRDNNSHVAIYKLEELNWKLLNQASFPDVVTCGVKTNFWVRWTNNLIQVGRGSLPHNILLGYRDKKTSNPVNAFSFGNSFAAVRPDYPLRWEMDKGALHTMAYRTMGPKNYHTGMWMSVYKQDYLVFRFRSCSKSYIALGSDAAISQYDAYEAEILVKRLETTFVIYKENTQVQTETIPTTWNCELDDIDFWVGWRNGTIEIGHGNIGEGVAAIQYYDPDPHDVNFLGFTTDGDTWWTLSNVQDDVYSHRTRAVNNNQTPSYKDFWMIPLRHVRAVSFIVRGEQHARIALSRDAYSLSKCFEIVLDKPLADGRRQSQIRDAVNGNIMKQSSVEPMLDKYHDRRLWVSWSGGENQTVRLGHGNVGTYEVMAWAVPSDIQHPVRAVGFGSGTNRPTNWKFDYNDAEGVHALVRANATDEWRLWHTVTGRNYIVFQVKGSSGVQVLLTSMLYESRSQAYLITMRNRENIAYIYDVGSNTKLGIHFSNTTKFTNGSRYVTFWVMWEEAVLKVGRGGSLNRNLMMSAPLSPQYRYPINSVGLDGWEKEADFTILRVQGEVYRTYTPDNYDYSTSQLLIHHNKLHYTFSLRACSNAYILLGASENWYGDDLELIIGSYDNTKVELRYRYVNDPEVIVEAQGVLHCNQLRKFYLDWEHGLIAFGSLNGGSEREILTWQFHEEGGPSQPFPMEYLQFATMGNKGEWELEETGTLDECSKQFKQIATKAEGRESQCPFVGLVVGDLQTCILEACRKNANLLMITDTNRCLVKKCPDPNDPQFIDRGSSLYDTWSLDTPSSSFIATTSGKLSLNYDQHWVTVIGYTSLHFKVRACAEVHLALAAVPANSETLAYEVVIGGNGNQQSFIRNNTGWDVTPVKVVETPGILACKDYQHMWVSWASSARGGTIAAGTGPLVGEEPFIEWRARNQLSPINAVGLSTAAGLSGYFMFGDLQDINIPGFEVPDETYLLRTTGDGKFHTHRWSIIKNYIIFSVQACSDVMLAITDIPDNFENTGTYIIKLGTDSNTKASIYRFNNITDKAEVTFPGLLNCTGPRVFWMQWTQRFIAIGRFGAIGLNAIVTLEDNQMPSKFSEMAISTDYNQDGYWEIRKSQGHLFKFQTPNTEKYNEVARTTLSDNSVVFKVKASNDAHILLSRNLDNLTDVYEVALGIHRNTYSVIRHCQQCAHVVSADNAGVLSATEYRTFWIRWYQGLEVGYGSTVGKNPMMRLHQVGTQPVEALRVMTGWGATGWWHFSDMPGEGFYLTPPPELNYGHIWTYKQTHYFEFLVRSCESAWIWLGETRGDASQFSSAYEIRLEGAPGKQSQILRYPMEVDKSAVKANATTPSLVACDQFTKVWVSWRDGVVRVGHTKLLENTLLFYMDDQPINVRAIALTTPSTQQTPSEWQFARDAVKGAEFTLMNDQPFVDWLIVDESTQFTYLKITASQDVVLILSSAPGVAYGHKIIVGKDKERTVTYTAAGSEVYSYAGNPLGGTVGRWFWLSWADNTLSMGLGLESGSDVIAYYDMDNEREAAYVIGAVGFRAETSVAGIEFMPTEGENIEVSTEDKQGYDYVWLLTPNPTIRFQVQGVKKARIALSTDTSDRFINGTDSYELILGADDDETEPTSRRMELWKFSTGKQTADQLFSKDLDLGLTVLDGDMFKEFWLMWGVTEGVQVFWLGEGPDLLRNQLFTYTDTDNPYVITSVGFATSQQGEVTKWMFSHDAAPLTKLHTTPSYDYNRFLFHVAALSSFVFKVRAARDAHVLLTEYYHSDINYEFIIGMSGNNFTAIREGKLTKPKVWAKTPSVLSEDEFRLFWVSWADKRLAVGSGGIVGRNEICGYDSTKIPFIQYLALSTWTEIEGDWEYIPIMFNTLLVNTVGESKDASFNVGFGDDKTDFSFEVQACYNAIVYMKTDYDSSATYQLIIGADANRRTYIYKDGVRKHEEATPDILHCLEKRRFWISWKEGNFELANGYRTGMRVLEWEDSSPVSVHALSMGTAAHHQADWSIPRYQAPLVRYKAYTYRAYDGFWMTVSELKSYVFRIQTPRDARLLLTDIPGVSTRFAYEIIIGGAENGDETTIKRVKTGEVLGKETTADILSADEFRWFWVSWGHYDENEAGLIKLGKGAGPGLDLILQAAVKDPIEVNGLGFSAGGENNVTWDLLTNTEGNVYQLHTDGLLCEHGAWIYPMDRYLHFDIQACQDAQVALVTDKDVGDGYQLLLGGYDNTASALLTLDGFEENGELKYASGLGRLECGHVKRFWIKWDDSTIKVGEGYDDTSPFLTYTDAGLKKINVIGFRSDNKSNAEWRIPQDQEKALVLATEPIVDYRRHWITLSGMDSVVFRVKECVRARVLLTYAPNDNIRFKEVVIGNEKSEIHNENHETVATNSTPNVLDCNHFKSFWIRWGRNNIYFGKGSAVGQNQLLSYENQDLHDIAAMAFTSGIELPYNHVVPAADPTQPPTPTWAHWQVFGLRGNTVKVTTPAEKSYDVLNWIPQNKDEIQLSFRVRTCNSAHVMFAPETSADTDLYEVVIGSNNNQRFEIRKGGVMKEHKTLFNILSDKQFRKFWAYWNHGNVSLGQGEFGERHAVSHYDSSAETMVAAGISTWDSCPGFWDLDQRIGDGIEVHTTGDYKYNKLHIMVLDTNYFVFKVKAAHSMHIALSVVPGVTETETWEFGININGGATNYISNKINPSRYIDSNQFPGLLSDKEFRSFWIEWDEDSVFLGQGETPGKLMIVGATKDNDAHLMIPGFSAFSFCTAYGVEADWKFEFTDGYVPPVVIPSPTTTTSTTTSTTTTTPSSTSTSTSSLTSSSTGTETSTTSSSEEIPPETDEGGLSGGQVAGVVIGVLLSVVLIVMVVFFGILRYKPDKIPSQVLGKVPVQVQSKLRRDPNSIPVHFTNPLFGSEGGLNINKITYGTNSGDGEAMDDFGVSGDNQPSKGHIH